jgi:hypothetical protein
MLEHPPNSIAVLIWLLKLEDNYTCFASWNILARGAHLSFWLPHIQCSTLLKFGLQ